MHSNGNPIDLDLLSTAPLLDGLNASRVAQLARHGWTVRHPRAARVLSRGDSLDGLFVVLSGKLKIFMLSCSGDERVIRLMQGGDSFGEAIMFNRIPSPVFVDTLAPTELAYLPAQVISETLQSNPRFVSTMLKSMSALMTGLITDLETCCLQSARQRTVGYLLREAENAPPPHIEVQLPAAKATIASTLNLSAETFSRELHRLHDQGTIEISRRTIYIRDRDGLLKELDPGSP